MAHPDKAEEFASQALRLMREPGLGAILARRAVLKMEKHYDWAVIIQRVDDFTKTILEPIQAQQKTKAR